MIGAVTLACMAFQADIRDSQLYEPTVEAFVVPEMQVRPSTISEDIAYGAQKIRQYSRKRRIERNIPTYLKRRRPRRFDPILYNERGAIERFLSWIEAFKKIVPRYKRYEYSLFERSI